MLGLNQVHSPEATGAEGPLDLKVAQRILALGDTGLRGLSLRILILGLLVLMFILMLGL